MFLPLCHTAMLTFVIIIWWLIYYYFLNCRNLFFRISYLTLMDVKLVFVMEGEPPKLKAEIISKRNQIRYGPSEKTWSQKTGRSHFKSVLKEVSIQIWFNNSGDVLEHFILIKIVTQLSVILTDLIVYKRPVCTEKRVYIGIKLT